MEKRSGCRPSIRAAYVSLSPARVLTGEPANEWFAVTLPLWTCINETTEEKLLAIDPSARIEDVFNPRYFCLMLAKIGHALAYAFHTDRLFYPLLSNIIRTQDVSIANYVGGANEPLPDTELHQLQIEWRKTNAGSFLVVKIKLFAWCGAPTYEVVVGRSIFP